MCEEDLRFRIWCVIGLILSTIGMIGVFVLSSSVQALPPLWQAHLTLSGFLFAFLFAMCFLLIAISPQPEDEFDPKSSLD